MALKAVLLDFNGVVINDEAIHGRLIEELLLEENLRPNPKDLTDCCLGRSDAACLKDLLARQGRVISEEYLEKLLTRKTTRYRDVLTDLDHLPLYPGLDDLVYQIRAAQLKLAIVSGARYSEIEAVLAQVSWGKHVELVISSDDLAAGVSKPAPDGYLLAIEQLNQQFTDLVLQPADCLAIEDSFAGIEAAKRAGVPVLGVAHAYPYQMIHRRATWAIDHLYELSLDWLKPYYSSGNGGFNESSRVSA
ncbi:HAD family phosphatase [Leptolyngbya sp. CCNP1308]|uniref:HAD family hydrolase n=1 Tax=Leptolyngbya sp. CCNP1308 TaxID=3110255 RepID=UPI002B1F6E40|nr:HAD family phosphatase [Leptolyngbya sp. CCNP1308]MEA5452749.1 HAD family phosphatase [Leptolyngbya sp. CCNP1308]